MNDIKAVLPFIKFSVFIFSFIAHELAHGYAAKFCGDRTPEEKGRLSLNPLRHFDLIGSFVLPVFLIFINASAVIGWGKPVPVDFSKFKKRSQHIFTASAGVIVNLLLAVSGLILYYFTCDMMVPEAGIVIKSICLFCFMLLPINLILIVFNLIPLCPLDGWVIYKGFSSERNQISTVKINPFIIIINIFTVLLILKISVPFLMDFVKYLTIW